MKDKEGGKISVEAGIEIFGEAFPDFGKAVVHPAADERDGVSWIGAVEVEDLESCLAHVAGDGDIFDHVIANRFVAMDFVVGAATKENELAVGGAKTAQATWGPVREVEKNKKVDEWNDELFAPAEGFEVRPKGKQIGSLLVGNGDGLGDRAIGEACVGIDKKEKFALGFFGELVARPGFASPTFGEGLTREEADPGVSLRPTLDE